MVYAHSDRLRSTADVVEELSHRVEELEGALRAGTPPSNEHSSSLPTSSTPASGYFPHSATPGAQFDNIRVARSGFQTPSRSTPTHIEPTCKLSRCRLGNNWYFKGIGVLSPRGHDWIAYGSGEEIFLEKFELFDNPTSAHAEAIPTLTPCQRALPPVDSCRYFTGIFLQSNTATIFPILDETLFQHTIARAYDPANVARRASAEACVWALLALVSFSPESQLLGSLPASDECAREAQRLLFSINGSVNMDVLQANMMLWAFQKMEGRCREAATAFASSCRLVCELGGHSSPKKLSLSPQYIPMLDEPSKFHVRKLFRLCYCFDKDSCLRTGRPPLLSYDYCEIGDFSELDDRKFWYSQPRDVKLAVIKERTMRLLSTPQAFQQTEGELLARARQLDDELEEWRSSIEPPYRPRLSIPPDSSPSVSTSMRAEDQTHVINLQLDYLFTVIHIHTMVRKCGDLEQNLADDLHSAVESSADLSLEASRSIFRYFDTVIGFWQHESVWVVSHYAPMAAMALFVNILIHPIGHPADTDLQILGKFGEIARKMPTDRLSVGEIHHIQEIGDFVMELIRLSHSAAWKVKKGEREHDLDILDS